MQRGRCALWRISRSCGAARNDAAIANPLLFACQGLRYSKTSMKVILTKDVDRLGRAGETVAVAPGYFRNYLMPKLLAVPNIEKYQIIVKDQLKLCPSVEEEVEEEDVGNMEEKMMEYKKAADLLAKSRLSLWRFIKTEKELQSPVTKEELISEVARQLCVSIQPENLNLAAPLVSLGEFEIPLRLPKQIPLPEGMHSWTLRVKIRKR